MFRHRISALLAALLLVVSAAPAEAQLKRLGKAITGKVVDSKITGATGADSSTPAPATTTGRNTNARSGVAPTGSTEITAERLEQFLVAVKPALDEARSHSAAVAKQKKFETDNQAFEECRVRIMSDPAEFTGMEDDDPAVIELNKRLKVANAALEKEIAKGATKMDQAKIAQLNVEMQDIVFEQQMLSYKNMKKCGTRPVPPAVAAPGGTPALAASARTDFTRQQFGLFRERIATWVMTQGKGDQRMVFTPAEQAVLKARAGDLAALESYLRDGNASWSAWGDLPSDWQ